MKKTLIVEIISCLFILLFVYTAASKLLDYENFRVELGKSPLLTTFAGWVGWTIPVTEIIVSVFLATKRWRLPALYASYSLMILFTAYLIAVLSFSFFVPCTCGGILQSMSWKTHILFNSAFIVLAITGIIIQSKLSRNVRII